MPNKQKIIPQMFDVRPVKKDGDLDLEKIEEVERRARWQDFPAQETAYCEDETFRNTFRDEIRQEIAMDSPGEKFFFDTEPEEDYSAPPEKTHWKNLFGNIRWKKLALSLSGAACGLLLFAFVAGFAGKGYWQKDFFLASGKIAYASIEEAKDGILSQNFQHSAIKFSEAYENFDKISKEINDPGGVFSAVARYIPYLSQLSSGKYLAEAGKDLSQIGALFSTTMEKINALGGANNASEPGYFLQIFHETDQNFQTALALLDSAQANLDKVNFEDVPEQQRNQISELKSKLPEIRNLTASFLGSSSIIKDILGGNGPRKYLFLFQNNNEMRATGGFIGTYGVLDIFNGRIRNFFIDGIFNPDGQLREKVVPPFPIQKISAAWSLHDSNWFPDFPVSAEKAIWFYEKTGGPTVDGVITMTPEVLRKLLEITGPIDMPDYGVTIDRNNFLEKIQYEVEVDYDKELNQPKKILSDLAPKILDRIFSSRNFSEIKRTLEILTASLNERHILIYSRNYEIEKKLSELAWSGEVLDTPKDYVSVINTNINGFKTDGVIDEQIEHQAEILPDGSIVDTLIITRKHNGGNKDYEWWNKVNANYMRVYVPKGSQFISVEGQTREFDPPPLEYDALGFKRDPQVKMEEDSIKIDEESGTRIYEDAGKTVFGNWTYVSPQETLVIKYKYLLPFKLDFKSKDQLDSYSLLAQKQAGSPNDKFISTLTFPLEYKTMWKYPENISANENNFRLETTLQTNQFIGAAFAK